VPKVDEALTYHLEKSEDFKLQLGDTWEIDELFVKLGKSGFSLIVVRDLKTTFDVAVNFAETVTSDAVRIVLSKAKAVAHKCPLELRCDGLPVYESPVKEVFGNQTKLSVYVRIRKEGQNQSMEGHNGALRSRLKGMRSMHSRDRSVIIIIGIIINYNWVRLNTVLVDVTPAEKALGKRSIDGKHSWLPLLELAVKFKATINNAGDRKGPSKRREEDTKLDKFFG
jgi:hypothetical protein